MRRALLLVLLPLALAACGGSDDAKRSATTTGSATTTAPSGDGYVAQGNQVCVRADRRIFAIGRLGRDPRGWSRTAASAKQAVREMRQVQPPARRAAAFNLMVRYGSALALSIQEVHDALVKKDYDTASAAQLAAGQLQDKVHSTARDAGLPFCQQALTNWPA